jgi:hypothetical protein
MGLGRIPVNEIIELTYLRLFEHVQECGIRDDPKWTGNLELWGTDPKKSPTGLERRDTEDFEKKKK